MRALVAVLLGVVLLCQVVYLSRKPRAAAEGPTPTRRQQDDPPRPVDPTRGYALVNTNWGDAAPEPPRDGFAGWHALDGEQNPGIGDLEFAVVEH